MLCCFPAGLPWKMQERREKGEGKKLAQLLYFSAALSHLKSELIEGQGRGGQICACILPSRGRSSNVAEVLPGCRSGILGGIPRGFRRKRSSRSAANPSSTWSERRPRFTSRGERGSSYSREDSCLLTSAGCGRLCSWLHRSPKEGTHPCRSLSFCYCLRKKKIT